VEKKEEIKCSSFASWPSAESDTTCIKEFFKKEGMIVKCALLGKGYECLEPRRYSPNRDVFDEFAHLYNEESEALFSRIGKELENTVDDEFGSEEKEDMEVRKSDRVVLSLVDPMDEHPRVDCYTFNEDEDVFYVRQDIFLNHKPSSMAVFESGGDPYVFVGSAETENISGYNVFVENPFLPDVFLRASSPILDLQVVGPTLISLGKNITEWDLNTSKKVSERTPLHECCLLDTEENMLISSDGHSLFVADRREGREKKCEVLSRRGVTQIKIREGRIYASYEDGCVGCVSQGSHVFEKKMHGEKISAFDISGKYIVTGAADERVRVMDMESQEVIEDTDVGETTGAIGFARDDPMLYAHGGVKGELALASIEECISRVAGDDARE
jgi:hypothetical protein